MALLIWAAVAPGLRVAQWVARSGMPPGTPAPDQSTALLGSMMPTQGVAPPPSGSGGGGEALSAASTTNDASGGEMGGGAASKVLPASRCLHRKSSASVALGSISL